MKVAINGASVAGLATAVALGRTGHDVTVFERSREVRVGGVAVDVRAEALDAARHLGILDQLRENVVTYEPHFDFMNSTGEIAATFDPNVELYESPDDLEVSRDVLVQILRDAVPETVEFCFGASISGWGCSDEGMAIRVEGGEDRTVDLVVGADGLHSRVRALAFGPEEDHLKHIGLYVGVLRRCATPIDVRATSVYNEPGRLVLVRGDGHDASAILGFRSSWLDYDYRDVQEQRRILQEAFAGIEGWLTQDLVAEVADAEDFYFDSVSQVVMPSWTAEGVALVGDSGYCASFFSGMGSSLALLGGVALADAIENSSDLPSALRRYETSMRPVVEQAQATAGDGEALLFPRTTDDIRRRNEELAAASAF